MNERKEYEPLGNQSVNTNGEENDYPPPTTQLEAMNSADDPSWMCQMESQMGRSFEGHDLPTRCQIAQAQNGIEVEILWKRNKEIVRDSPLPRFVRPDTPSDTVLVFARKATVKAEDEDDEIIPPTNI